MGYTYIYSFFTHYEYVLARLLVNIITMLRCAIEESVIITYIGKM